MRGCREREIKRPLPLSALNFALFVTICLAATLSTVSIRMASRLCSLPSRCKWFCYRLIFREEAELFRAQSDRFVTYCQAVPRLLPTLKERVSASGALPAWQEALASQTPWWSIAAGEVAYAVTLRLSIALLVALAGVPVHVAQKRARFIRLAATKTMR